MNESPVAQRAVLIALSETTHAGIQPAIVAKSEKNNANKPNALTDFNAPGLTKFPFLQSF